MKNKFVSLLFVTTLSTPLLFSSCGSTQSQEDHSLKEVSYKDFLKASELTTESFYNSAYVSYFDKSEAGDKTENNDKYVFVDDSWVHQYGLKKASSVENYLNTKLDEFLTYIETREDFAKLKFYLSDSLFYISSDTYKQEFEASFNIYGDPLFYKGWTPDNHPYFKYYCEISANYYFENVKVVSAGTIRISDMYFEYNLINDSYLYLGYNQRIEPFEMNIPNTFDDGVHGEKAVEHIDTYSLIRSPSLYRLKIGKNVNYMNWEYQYDYNCKIQEFIVDEDNQNYCSVYDILYSKDCLSLIKCPPGMNGTAYIDDRTETIDFYAFASCHDVTGVNGCLNLQFILPNSFKYSGIKTFVAPESLVAVSMESFACCNSLEYVDLANIVSGIGYHAFWECYNLKEVIIGTSVKTIHGSAFDYCDELHVLTYEGTMDEWNKVTITEGWSDVFLNNSRPVVRCIDGTIDLRTETIIGEE